MSSYCQSNLIGLTLWGGVTDSDSDTGLGSSSSSGSSLGLDPLANVSFAFGMVVVSTSADPGSDIGSDMGSDRDSGTVSDTAFDSDRDSGTAADFAMVVIELGSILDTGSSSSSASKVN